MLLMLINDNLKLINITRQFTKAPLAVSFFGSSCYEGCVRNCFMLGNTLKIPVSTDNFTKKKIHFQAFLTILFIVQPDS